MKKLIFTTIGILIMHLIMQAKDYNIVDFGAVPDGAALNTEQIQAAIDQAHSDGGGRVIIPPGKFVSGSIHIKSNVELHLMNKAELIGSENYLDYEVRRWVGFIMGYEAENIGITGRGIINGQGALIGRIMDSLFYIGEVDSSMYNHKDKRPRAEFRPMLILLSRCKNIVVKDITLKNAACWVQTYDLCRNVTIDNVTVDSDSYWNNDGIDIVDCKNVRITNCDINSSDDGICLKSFSLNDTSRLCDNIYISDCSVRSSASAIKCGTSSYGGFKNVVIERINIKNTYRSAIALECYQTGIMENILIQNITAKNTGNAIFVRLGRKPMDNYLRDSVSEIKNVTIRNVKVTVPFKRPDYDYELRGPALPFFHNIFPSSIVGIPGHPIENVTLENIKITYPGRGNRAFANLPLNRLDDIPEKPGDYPEFSMFGELPAWGFYLRHVDGVNVKNVKIKIKDEDYRPAIVCDDVKNMRVESLKVKGDNKANDIILHKSENVEIID